METMKDILNLCNAAIFYDYKNICLIVELNQVRKFIINNFHETITVNRILITSSFIDDIILKINDNNIDNIIE